MDRAQVDVARRRRDGQECGGTCDLGHHFQVSARDVLDRPIHWRPHTLRVASCQVKAVLASSASGKGACRGIAYQPVCQMLWRAVEFEWAKILCFHLPEFKDRCVVDQEIEKELAWAQARPNSRAHNRDPVVFVVDDEPFLAVLTETEHMHWQAYKARWPGTAGQLNQDSMSQHATHSSKQCLHTLIANCGLIMSDQISPERWLLASECLLAQGFPVLPGCFGNAELLGDYWHFCLLCCVT